MNIDKAIEINEQTYHQYEKHLLLDQRDAIKLGIEALERLHYCRSGEFNEPFELLPGETEE